MYCGFSWLNYYNQSPDWIKALWVLSIPAFVGFMSWLGVWFYLSLKALKLRERSMAAPEAESPAA